MTMRKQDRIANQEQKRPQEQATKESSRPEPRDQERVKGSASETPRPQRQSGKLPLPD
jgi:hypothetical protein